MNDDAPKAPIRANDTAVYAAETLLRAVVPPLPTRLVNALESQAGIRTVGALRATPWAAVERLKNVGTVCLRDAIPALVAMGFTIPAQTTPEPTINVNVGGRAWVVGMDEAWAGQMKLTRADLEQLLDWMNRVGALPAR